MQRHHWRNYKAVLQFRMECKQFLLTIVKKLLAKSPILYSLVRNLSAFDPREMTVERMTHNTTQLKSIIRSLIKANRASTNDADDNIQQYSEFIQQGSMSEAAMKIDFSKWLAFLLQDFKLIRNQPKLISKTKMPNRSLSSSIHNRNRFSIHTECWLFVHPHSTKMHDGSQHSTFWHCHVSVMHQIFHQWMQCWSFSCSSVSHGIHCKLCIWFLWHLDSHLVHAGRPFLSQSNSSLRPYHLSSRSRFLHWCFVLPCLLSECHLQL